MWLRTLKTKRFWIFVLFVLILGGLTYLVIFSNLFQVEEIQIKRNQKVKNQDILGIVEPKAERSLRAGSIKVFSSKSLFLINSRDMEEELLARFPQIGEVHIKRGLPRTLVVEVREREPFAEICQPSGECFVVDQEGVAFEKSAILKDEESGLKVLEVKRQGLVLWLAQERDMRLGKQAIILDYLQAVDAVHRNLEQQLELGIDKITLAKDNRLNIKIEQGFKLYFNIDRNIENQLFNLGLVLEEKISAEELLGLEYIDLRFGNRVYYK